MNFLPAFQNWILKNAPAIHLLSATEIDLILQWEATGIPLKKFIEDLDDYINNNPNAKKNLQSFRQLAFIPNKTIKKYQAKLTKTPEFIKINTNPILINILQKIAIERDKTSNPTLKQKLNTLGKKMKIYALNLDEIPENEHPAYLLSHYTTVLENFLDELCLELSPEKIQLTPNQKKFIAPMSEEAAKKQIQAFTRQNIAQYYNIEALLL